jgi:hypothetical protein
MKKKSTLILLGAVLVVCIGAYIGVAVYNNAQAQKTADKEKASQIWQSGWGAPVSISYTTGDTTLSFVLESDTWKVAGDKAFPLAQTSLTGIASALRSLAAVRTIDAPQALPVYGLDKPAFTLTAADAKGSGMTLLIGAQNGGNYYAMAQGGGKVWTIGSTLPDGLKPDYLSMITLETLPSFTTKDITQVTLFDGSSTLTLDQHLNKDGSYTWFVVRGDKVTAADEITLNAASDKSPQKFIDDAVNGLGSLQFSSCAAYKPGPDALKTYGLDFPKLTIIVDYAVTTGQGTLDQKTTKSTMSLEIGTLLPDSSGYCARIPGSDQVGLLAAASVTPLLDAVSAMGSV